MTKNKNLCHYTKAIFIVHGFSEYQMMRYIKSNLRLKIEISSKEKGGSSIQITSVKNWLKKMECGNLRKFADDKSIEYDKENKKLKNFKLFIIMDTDDCSESLRDAFINGSMFIGNVFQEYIVPIYNISNLEDVMSIAKISDTRPSKKGKRKEYLKIFPLSLNPTILESKVQIEEFQKKVIAIRATNLEKVTQYCLEIAQENQIIK